MSLSQEDITLMSQQDPGNRMLMEGLGLEIGPHFSYVIISLTFLF